MKNLIEYWDDLRVRSMHPRAPAEQINEMKKAFLIGFAAMFEIATTTLYSPEAKADLKKQIDEFVKEIDLEYEKHTRRN